VVKFVTGKIFGVIAWRAFAIMAGNGKVRVVSRITDNR
jgi:hypothetical protein